MAEQRKKAVFMVCYFGKLPNYFPLWVKTAQTNTSFDFYIFTDQTPRISDNSNVHIFPMTFAQMQERIKAKLGNGFVIRTPYKLCDYKVAYGLLFEEYISAYPFWGFALEISNWNQVASPNLDSVASLLANYTTTNRIYKDSDNVNHLLICAGAPICEVKAGEIVGIDMEFEDKTESYDVWFSMNGWERASRLDASSNVLSRDNIFLDKSLTQKAGNGSFGDKSVSALNGSKKFYVRIPEKGVLFVKWSLSGNGGAGGGKYLPKDKVLVISE